MRKKKINEEWVKASCQCEWLSYGWQIKINYFVCADAALIGAFIPNKSHNSLRTFLISAIGWLQSVSDRHVIASFNLSSGMSITSPWMMSASYNFVAVHFLTWTCGRPRKTANELKIFAVSSGTYREKEFYEQSPEWKQYFLLLTWISWQKTLMLEISLNNFLWPLISIFIRR